MLQTRWITGLLAKSHDDVIKWKHFPVTGPLWGNSPVTDEFPSLRPVTRSFDVFFDLRLNKRLSKQSWGWWFETPSGSLWRHLKIAPFFAVGLVTLTIITEIDVQILCPSFGRHPLDEWTSVSWAYQHPVFKIKFSHSNNKHNEISVEQSTLKLILPLVPHVCVSELGKHWFR